MVKVITVGCRLNQAEGERIKSLFGESCYAKQIGDFNPQTTDVYIINTCAVTREAARTSWKMIRRQLNSKSDTHNTKLIVTGCLATLEREKMLETPGIDSVITQSDKTELLKLIDIKNVIPNNYRSRPVVKIQDGCPNECSYCVARVIRGKLKSTAPQIILDEINKLADFGYQEIVLTGLNLGSYGQDIQYSLAKLLTAIFESHNNRYGRLRIRLSSLEPDTITDELLTVCFPLMTDARLCRHFHIPLQSGDNRILELMRRKYTVDEYRRLIDKIISNIPEINIGTDIIVGFPEEDETAFNNTVKLVEETPFGYLHVFPYSARPQTDAAKIPETVETNVKKERVRILRKITEKKRQLFRDKFTGSSLGVVVESRGQGLTDNYIRVTLSGNEKYQKGQLYNLII
jgi:threonylcarbamoyladenosine tRNA methylthiotransferase MtaB